MKSLFKGLADLLFPPRCLSCNELLVSEDDCDFCPDCKNRISFFSPPFCPICGFSLPPDTGDNNLCLRCAAAPPPFEACRSMGRYESVLLEAIHDLKYRRRIAAGVALGNLLASCIRQYLPVQDYDLVIPVPLHRKRLRERGFNQSLILARAIARNFSLTVDFKSLQRVNHTQPQINLGRKERESNVRNAFAVVGEKAVANSRVLLVDDVYTTGSTVKECAKVLLKNGAKSVAVATLARA